LITFNSKPTTSVVSYDSEVHLRGFPFKQLESAQANFGLGAYGYAAAPTLPSYGRRSWEVSIARPSAGPLEAAYSNLNLFGPGHAFSICGVSEAFCCEGVRGDELKVHIVDGIMATESEATAL
jgi:hypothetical protein